LSGNLAGLLIDNREACGLQDWKQLDHLDGLRLRHYRQWASGNQATRQPGEQGGRQLGQRRNADFSEKAVCLDVSH
jgi:hypothetical protein